MAIGEQVAGEISQTPVEATLTEEVFPRETRLARTSPVEEPSLAASDPALAEPGPPVGDALPDTEPSSGSAIRFDPVSGSTTVPAEQDGPKTPVDTYLALPDPRPTTSEPVIEPAPGPVDPDRSPLDLEPEPVAIEESNPLPLLTREAPAAEPAVLYMGEQEDSYLPYVLGTSVAGAVESLEGTLESAAANALDVLVDEALSWSAAEEGEGLIDTTLAG